MPTPDFPFRRRHRAGIRRFHIPGLDSLAWLEARKPKRRKPGKDRDDGGVLVEPDRPLNLSGGATAPLEFEND